MDNSLDKLSNVHENSEEIEDEIHTAELDLKEPTYPEVDAAWKKLKNKRQQGMILY